MKPLSTQVSQAKEVEGDLDADAPPHLTTEKKTEEGQLRSYASPPCYLAEFSDENGENDTTP